MDKHRTRKEKSRRLLAKLGWRAADLEGQEPWESGRVLDRTGSSAANVSATPCTSVCTTKGGGYVIGWCRRGWGYRVWHCNRPICQHCLQNCKRRASIKEDLRRSESSRRMPLGS